MRILWINHRDLKHPQAGGAEVRLYEISRRLYKMGVKVVVLSERAGRLPTREVMDGVEVKRMGNSVLIHLAAPIYVLKHGREYDVIIDDIAHAVPWYSPIVTRTPVIAQIHHVHQNVVDVELSKPLAWVARNAERTIPRVYRHFITVSKSTKQELVYRFNINPNTIAVIPNGVDLSKYKPGVKDPKPTILWVGRIKKYKRLEHLLLSYKIVKNKVPDAKLIIVGRGDYEDYIKRLAKSLGLTDVHFMGRVSEKTKIMLMQRAWVLVSTSIVEGWGLTVTEAAACRTPAIAYKVPGLKDSIRHMNTGILVEPGDIVGLVESIISMLVDDALRNRMAENAYNYARQFDWDNIAKLFIRYLEQVSS